MSSSIGTQLRWVHQGRSSNRCAGSMVKVGADEELVLPVHFERPREVSDTRGNWRLDQHER